ncbi:hypothetical protein [Pediococcus argentinicus]|uniref:Uncharacterized protein n=1 Tax=Pediococcus argentinicus TaxID=480391 RepID=A0A0R2NH26_9LACO|nr:hypothetical protein [Pediococcus argentinicus]KRO25094.1 hypothetical protein IV88_GL000427 [Pediococcus argentinicus]NKZ22562.1 hypothetical protein [Pediococcus argentinicus]GEP19600.1 hypothetical protein LSA03_09840 [Pediococcus argentinicus]
MADKQMHIDPEKFAGLFLQTTDISNLGENEIQGLTKKALAAYLSAYYLADKFNNQEKEFFEDKTDKRSVYQRIISELNQY